jgi:hypothetical protein
MASTDIDSDKVYWHRYIDFYESKLSDFDCRNALEFGVYKGASIKWLMNRFPDSNIYGADISNVIPSWPIAHNVKYFKVDQDNILSIANLFQQIGEQLDLVIEDGSHFPTHQRNCLVEAIPHIRSGGFYILEDIHTSHPNHPYYRRECPFFKSLIGPLHLLVAIEHLKLSNRFDLKQNLKALSVNSLFEISDIEMLYERIDQVKIYKRTALPLHCFACGGTDFNYHTLKCKCGVSLYAETDSMSALIRIK